MDKKLRLLAERARSVAEAAERTASDPAADREPVLLAMMAYREAAIGYMADPAVAEYMRFDALKYSGETREAIERIAELVDRLNEAS